MNARPSSNSPNRSDLDTSTGHSPASDFDYAGSISASSSVDSSPAVIPKAIRRANSGSDDNHSPRRRTTPPYLQNNSHDRLSLEMGRPSSAAGKGGCWTCRLRRKKCDEIREGDSCQTCRRLQLKCLGWGPKRPEWMRDKDAVAQYKAEIKAHLLKLGLIRGQPRSNFIQTIPSTSTGSSAPPLSRHHSGGELQSSFRHDRHDQRQQITLSPQSRGHSLGLGLGLGQEHSHGGMGHAEFGHGGVFGFEHTPPLDMNFPSNAVTDPHLFELTPTVASSGAAARALASSNNNNSSDVSAMSSAFDFPSTNMGAGSLSSLAGTNLPLSAATTPTGLLGFDTFSDEPRRQQQQQQQQQRAYHYDGLALRIPAGSGNNGGTVRRDHVVYYFDNVKGLQYLFSTKQAMDALYATLTEDPSHSLTDAVCAIASLHYNRTQPASLPSSSMNHPPDDTLAHFFHSQAAYPLTSISQRGLHSHITEYDVMTALHLVSYSLASVGGKVVNGSTGWGGMADFAIEWLTQTNLHLEDNPKEAMAKMSPSGAFAVRATMCIDIFMSLTIRQPPRLLALYRRLLGDGNSGNNGGNGWSSASHSRSSSISSVFGAASVSRNNATSGTTSGVEQLIVCTDGVLLALAEMAALAHWKAQETRNNSLSMRELVARGNAIERSLSQHRDMSVDISLATFGDMHRDSAGMMLPPMRDGRTFEQQTSEEMSRKLAAAIWFEAAMMYLNSILSGPCPSVPEITSSANTIMHLLQRLPTTNLDRALLLPLGIAGGLMDDQQQRMTVRNRLLRFGEDNVNVRQIVGLMLAVWQRRDSTGTVVDWRDVMQEQALALLFM